VIDSWPEMRSISSRGPGRGAAYESWRLPGWAETGAAAAAAPGIRTNRSAHEPGALDPDRAAARAVQTGVQPVYIHRSAAPERDQSCSHVELSRRYPMPAMLGAARAYMHMHINLSLLAYVLLPPFLIRGQQLSFKFF
jgi:hypothetical protein